MSTITRLGTANMYDSTLRNINGRQSDLANIAEKNAAGKRVLRPSDDPVAAAQAERAITRMARTDADQRALDAQRGVIEYAGSTLKASMDALQEFRGLLLGAGNGAYEQSSRDALVTQMTSLRDQLLTYANRKDSNGLPLFRGLDSSEQPIQGYNFAGQPGQTASSDNSIANTIDGAAAWMNVPTGNGVLAVSIGAGNTGKAWADVGVITDPAAATALTAPVDIAFSKDASGNLQYSLDGGATFTSYKSGDAINVAGMKLTVTGEPAVGDKFTVKPSERTTLFNILDQAIAAVRSGAKANGSTDTGALTHAVTRGVAEIDAGLNRLSSAQSLTGDLLNRADRVEEGLALRKDRLEGERSSAEDIDLIAGQSEQQMRQLGLQAALQSYASIQKLSLFNFIN
ncbi:flagellar hook-associated protein FlgL [Comamonas sp. Y6]|uniref:Flagellar hook-associated protein FlgL n=1 Tax=Comamonas resistens TaxID=3046670 RepID=A0ABY8SUK0_9BURK|nr:flagellar hook-associated protein FlgL [Comamonas resistens]MDL5038638.1 flagellar hook-associated protein FlgL [Comamonas resistens]WHS65994.1 flagellar hook-associated protein FlgL [Comamonas resistens]